MQLITAVATRHARDAFRDLADREHAGKQIDRRSVVDPRDDLGLGPSIDQFREHVGVEKISHAVGVEDRFMETRRRSRTEALATVSALELDVAAQVWLTPKRLR